MDNGKRAGVRRDPAVRAGVVGRGVVIAALCAWLGGCAQMAQWYAEGPKWLADNEAQKKELERQGFPQYSPPI